MTMRVLPRHRAVVTIRGVPTRVLGFDGQHSVNQTIGTASVTLPLPLPPHLMGGDGKVLNVPILIQAGYEDTGLRPVFAGRIDADRMVIDPQQRTATLSARGWGTLLDWREERDLVFPGPIPLLEIVRSLCIWRGVPASRGDAVTHPDGVTTIMLGGNPFVDSGNVIIPKRTSPLSWIDRKLRLFGYRIFDLPTGEVRVQRVSGTPAEPPVARFAEGENVYRIERTRDLAPMVTAWTVEGATYQDLNGVSIPVRIFPAIVPPDPLLDPPGYRADRITDGDLVTFQLADAARIVAELDHAAPYRELRWDARADPNRMPGDVIEVHAPTFGASGPHWLMGTRVQFEDSEYITTYDAWAGSGTALLPGTDVQTIPLGVGPYHVGSSGLTIPFTIPDTYTSIAVSGTGHGINTDKLDGAGSTSGMSGIEVWQNGERVGNAELPVLPDTPMHQAWRMPVPGRHDPGAAELRFIPGTTNAGVPDTFTVANVLLELRGAGVPTLPTPGGG